MHRATIRFLSKEEGGRFRPPIGPGIGECNWSLRSTLLGEDGENIKAHAEFIADEAPHHLLVPGSLWELFEGHHRVADLIIGAEI